jgi:integrase
MAATTDRQDIGSTRKIRLHHKPNKGGYWEVWWTDHAAGFITCKQSTKTKDIAEAQAYLAAFCDDARARERAVVQARVPSVEELCRRWLVAAITAGKTDGRFVLAAIRRAFGHVAGDQVDSGMLAEYAQQRQASCGTIRRELGALRTVLIWAAKQRLIGRAQVPGFVDMPPDSPPRTRFLDSAQEQYFWDQAMGWRDRRVRMFVALALESAARRGAIVELTWERVDLRLGQIDYRVPGRRETKKRRVRVPISDRLMPILKEAWLQAPKDPGGQAGGYVVTGSQDKVNPQTMSSAFRHFAEAIGMEWVSPHVLRHSWASLAVMNGVSLWDIAQVMGDTIAVIEKTYLHLTPGHLRSAINHKAKAPAALRLAD